jgi:hypothetical protein
MGNSVEEKEIEKHKKIGESKNEGAQGEAAAATNNNSSLGVGREMENFQSTSFKSSRKYSFHFMEK